LVAFVVVGVATSRTVRDVMAFRFERPNDMVAHHYELLSFYEEQDWSSQYWQEHGQALKKIYHPYVIWRSPAYSGELLNIDDRGLRLTPGRTCQPGDYTVFAFGGSAMWGWGAPDWGTIPAFLEERLQESWGESLCVVNYGEQAYVSTQSLIQMLLLLDSGTVPDLVVFYDGVNEIFAARQSGKPLLHQNFSEIASRFDGRRSPYATWFASLKSYQLVRLVGAQLGGGRKGEVPQETLEPGSLAESVVQSYLSNYKIVQELSRAYGFDFAFFWQPHILIGNKPLSEEEEGMLSGLDWVVRLDPILVDLFQGVWDRIQHEVPRHERLFDLASVFAGVERSIWIDTWGHVTPEGNRLIAAAMAEILVETASGR